MKPRVVAFIGAPGSGKSTLAGSFDPAEWVTLTLDDFRQTLWPPNRRIYWDVLRAGSRGESARKVLHVTHLAALRAALSEGFNVVLPDTHIRLPAFRDDLAVVAEFGITIEWKLFDVPWHVLRERNATRHLDHRLTMDVLESAYRDLWAEDAWWRELPAEQIQITKFRPEKVA